MGKITTTGIDYRPSSEEAARQEEIDKLFIAGRRVELESLIKRSMNDPKSFSHVSTSVSDKGDYLIVSIQFRGKNAFGGTVLDSVDFHIDINGNVLESITD